MSCNLNVCDDGELTGVSSRIACDNTEQRWWPKVSFMSLESGKPYLIVEHQAPWVVVAQNLFDFLRDEEVKRTWFSSVPMLYVQRALAWEGSTLRVVGQSYADDPAETSILVYLSASEEARINMRLDVSLRPREIDEIEEFLVGPVR